jgi:class 3 adenylate cyclase
MAVAARMAIQSNGPDGWARHYLASVARFGCQRRCRKQPLRPLLAPRGPRFPLRARPTISLPSFGHDDVLHRRCLRAFPRPPQAWEGRLDCSVGPPTTIVTNPKLAAPQTPQGPRGVDGIDPHVDPMLRAIRDLGNASVTTTASSTTEATQLTDAERRQLTVMFCDLVGSTALSTKLDPEDLRSVIGAYHKCVAETVARFDGFVAKYMGDGVLIYFGYPHAHEDDAERAVRAGLALIEAVGKLRVQEPLQVRIGVATGLVVVGDLVGSGEAQERGVVGETPNLAARLQAIADPDTVVIADGTRKLLGNLFDLQELGPRDLKGLGGPMPRRCWSSSKHERGP